MKSGGIIFLLAALFSTAALGQSTPPKFVMASVHAVPPAPNPFMRSGFYKGGRYEAHTATLLDLARAAYGFDADKVLGADNNPLPAWITKDLFEVAALAPADTTPDSLKLMLQALLAERFALVVHRDTKPVTAYIITAGPKPLLKEADGTGETECKIQSNTTDAPGNSPGVSIVRANFNGNVVQLNLNEPFPFACRNITIEAFANGLRAMLGAQPYIANTPVVDQTELKGKWDFDIKWTFRQGPQAPPSANAVTMFDAFDKLGLKLELGKAPFPVLIVDSANQTPTPDLPGVTEKLAPPPLQFEVADFKPAIPVPNTGGGPGGGGRGGLMFQAINRLGMRGQTIKSLIAAAWNLNSAESVIGGPKSLDTVRFDVDAMMPTPEVVPGFAPTVGLDLDSARQMLRTLLKDRLKLEIHEESRPVPTYELTVSNPSLLKKANGAGRPGCIEGPGADGKDPRTTNPVAGRLVTCLNMTMAEFASELRNRASGYLGQSPVPIDSTHLDGKYDFTLNFSGAGVTAPGAITLDEALEQQLGLKLGMGNHPGTAMVIDHCEENPIEN